MAERPEAGLCPSRPGPFAARGRRAADRAATAAPDPRGSCHYRRPIAWRVPRFRRRASSRPSARTGSRAREPRRGQKPGIRSGTARKQAASSAGSVTRSSATAGSGRRGRLHPWSSTARPHGGPARRHDREPHDIAALAPGRGGLGDELARGQPARTAILRAGGPGNTPRRPSHANRPSPSGRHSRCRSSIRRAVTRVNRSGGADPVGTRATAGARPPSSNRFNEAVCSATANQVGCDHLPAAQPRAGPQRLRALPSGVLSDRKHGVT